MGDVLKFPSPEITDFPELSEEQRELMSLLGCDPATCRFVELSGFDQDASRLKTIVVPTVMWHGHVRVIFPDGNMIIRNSLEPRQ